MDDWSRTFFSFLVWLKSISNIIRLFPVLKFLINFAKKRLLSLYSNPSAFSFKIALALIILVYSNCVAVTLLRWSTALLALPIQQRVCSVRERIWKTSTLSTSWESLEAARKPTDILYYMYLESGSITFITLDSIFCQLLYEIVCFSSPEMNLWSCQWQRKGHLHLTPDTCPIFKF